MRNRRAVITGLGVVAPNGIGKHSFWANLVAGKSAVDHISAFDPSDLPCRVAAEVHDFHPEKFMAARRTKHRGRFSQLAVAAAKLALDDSALGPDGPARAGIPICLGTSVNGMGDIFEASYAGFQRHGVKGFPPMAAVEYAAHAAASHVSAELGLGGQALTLASACTTGLDAADWARREILRGAHDIVIAGATDAPIAPFSFAAICGLGVLTRFGGPPELASRPYDLHRDGLVIGEGAAIFVIEDLEHAILRSAPIYAEILGFGSGNEGAFLSRADAAELALVQALSACLDSAGLSPAQVDHINAHGNALPDYDIVETAAFKRVFGQHAYSIPISSIKSMIGHALGAGSALQLAAACLSIQHHLAPPTINLLTPDPQCDLDYVPSVARRTRMRHLLINAHAMGGTHSVLALGGQL